MATIFFSFFVFVSKIKSHIPTPNYRMSACRTFDRLNKKVKEIERERDREREREKQKLGPKNMQ